MMNISGNTRVFGIIGRPVSHSLSPVMHNAAFAERGEDCLYVPFPAETAEGAVAGIRGLGICGVSVTIPHKESVLPLLDEIDPVAVKIGAVNTIVAKDSGNTARLLGTNTDWQGANAALAQVTGLSGSTAVILGAGGSARAIGFGLLEAGARIEIYSRTESRGRRLAASLGCPWRSLAEIGDSRGDILINATSVGMAPDDQLSPVPREVLANFATVMDIVYSPLQTRLLREARDAGCSCVNGLEMLLHQGAAQFELWVGRPAPLETMRRALLEAVTES